MGKKLNAESVIARLMSLDEQPPQRRILKQKSALSENYLLKTASIGLREGSSFSIGNSLRLSSGQQKGIKDTSEVQISKDQHGTQSVNHKSSDLSTKKLQAEILKILPGPRCKNGDIFSKKRKWHAPVNVLKSLQKVENDSLTGHCGELSRDHLNDFLKSQLEILDRSYHSSTRTSVLRGSRDCESRTATTSESSSYNFSCLGLADNNPEAYSKAIQDSMENGSEKESRCGDMEHVSSRSTVETKLANAEFSSRIIKDKNSEQNLGIYSVTDVHYSDVWEAFTQQELSNESFEEEFHMTLKGKNQHSPDSVLSPHETENFSISECFESVATDFESLFESEETHSEGSGMSVSSNEDIKNESDDLSKDGRILRWSFGYEESRDFSYLLDVLDEAGLDHVDLLDFSRTFNSQENPVSPLLFKALEKKYSKQTSWRKSERKLLFDRMNSELKEIITIPLFDFDKYTTPVRRRFSTTINRDEVEEELLQYLISQEKSKELSKKVQGKEMKWFELEEDVNIIVRELESFLFDELAIECVH